MALKLSTTKSLYKPITIEIDGVQIKAKPLKKERLRQIAEIEKRIRAGNVLAAYDQIEVIFGKQKKFEKLELRQVNEIIEYVTNSIFRPEKELPKEEKNSTRPGDKT